MRILCCEDEEEVLQIYEQALDERGHEVTTTLDSDECLKIYEGAFDEINDNQFVSLPFDVVILDYKMPKKNGLELAR